MNCSHKRNRQMPPGCDRTCLDSGPSEDAGNLENVELFLFGSLGAGSRGIPLAKLYRGKKGYFTHADRTAPKD